MVGFKISKLTVAVASDLKNFKTNTTDSNWLIQAEFQNWNIIAGTFGAQFTSTMATGNKRKIRIFS